MSSRHRPDEAAGPSDSDSGTLSKNPRVQSEVVGVALLTGVVVIVALSVGVVVISQASGDDPGPTTDLVLDVSAAEMTLSHNGGDWPVLSELRVTLEADGDRRTFTPDPANVTGGDDRLSPGERIRRDHGADPGDLSVLVVHRPSNTVLLDDRETVPATPTPTAVPTATP